MTLSRRRFLQASGVVAASAALGSVASLGSLGRLLAAATWGAVLTTFDGQPVHYNGVVPSYARGDSGFGPRWQALELIQRYCFAKHWTGAKHWPGVVMPYQVFDADKAPAGLIRHGYRVRGSPRPDDPDLS